MASLLNAPTDPVLDDRTSAAAAPGRCSASTSAKFKELGFVCVCLIVLVHSATLRGTPELLGASAGLRAALAFQAILSDGFARVALPFFFFVSGYFFFLAIPSGSTGAWYWPKLRRRLATMGIPYLLWTLVAVLTLEVFRRVIMSGALHPDAAAHPIGHWIKRILIDSAPLTIWYLREVLIYAALSPLFYLAVRFAGKTVLALLALWWCIELGSDRYYFVTRGMLFFLLGAYVAVWRVDLELALRRFYRWYFPLVWVFLVVAKTAWLSHSNYSRDVLYNVLHNAAIVIGLSVVWRCYDSVKPAIRGLVRDLSQYTFFVFAIHTLLQAVPARLCLSRIDKTDFLAHTCYYLVLPPLVVLSCVGMGFLLKRHFRPGYDLMTGWR